MHEDTRKALIAAFVAIILVGIGSMMGIHKALTVHAQEKPACVPGLRCDGDACWREDCLPRLTQEEFNKAANAHLAQFIEQHCVAVVPWHNIESADVEKDRELRLRCSLEEKK